jgi:Leucine-rich repeat (LRR) protein
MFFVFNFFLFAVILVGCYAYGPVVDSARPKNMACEATNSMSVNVMDYSNLRTQSTCCNGKYTCGSATQSCCCNSESLPCCNLPAEKRYCCSSGCYEIVTTAGTCCDDYACNPGYVCCDGGCCLPSPTAAPTRSPTAPTTAPTKVPTVAPTVPPTARPSVRPTVVPSRSPTTSLSPTRSPTRVPTASPSRVPTRVPTSPTVVPTRSPTRPTSAPTLGHATLCTTEAYCAGDSQFVGIQSSPQSCTNACLSWNGMTKYFDFAVRVPFNGSCWCGLTCEWTIPNRYRQTYAINGAECSLTLAPTAGPTLRPTTGRPSSQPTGQPTKQPVSRPSGHPTGQPSRQPSRQPTVQPSSQPSSQPVGRPSRQPTSQPTRQPSRQPTGQPTRRPSGQPTRQPSRRPTGQPTSAPSDRLHRKLAVTTATGFTEPEQKFLLLDFYSNLRGNFWFWNTTPAGYLKWNVSSDPCLDNWYGITCKAPDGFSSFRTVIDLELPSFGLKGKLPVSVVGIRTLETLNLADNNIFGHLDEVSLLPALKELDLSSNYFNGTILPLKSMNLVVLNLGDNNLAENIPDNLFRSPFLTELNLTYNYLIGSIPAFEGDSLSSIDLSRNGFDHNIPDFNMPNAVFLDLHANYLNGTIPNFKNLSSIQTLYLYKNELSGTLPDLNYTYGDMISFSVSHNYLTGSVPDYYFPNVTRLEFNENQFLSELPLLSNCSKLQYLFFYDNLFFGSLPYYSHLKSLKTLSVGDNWLSGSLPELSFSELLSLNVSDNLLSSSLPSFTNLPKLQFLYLYKNGFTGNVSARLFPVKSDLRDINLSENRFTGNIEFLRSLRSLAFVQLRKNRFSTFLSSGLPLPNVTYFSVASNKIKGSIPNTLSLPKLESLYLSENLFTGNFPEFNSPNLQSVTLDTNSFQGSLPTFRYNKKLHYFSARNNYFGNNRGNFSKFANTPELSSLDLTGNRFSGTLPDLSNLKKLDLLFLANNFFAGTIPQHYFKFKSLKSLSIGVNKLNGTIPVGFSRIPGFETFYAPSNLFTGTIPEDLMNLASLKVLTLSSNQLHGNLTTLNCTELKVLDLHNNSFTGEVPQLATSLIQLNLANNLFTGEIQQEGEFNALQALQLGNNRFRGSINDLLSSAPNLFIVSLENNSFTGNVYGVANMTLLKTLSLGNNGFSGDIAESLPPSHDIGYVDLSNNLFTGFISRSWLETYNSSLFTLALTKNCLTFPELPEELCRSTNLKVVIFDGLQSANKCQKKLFSQFIHTFAIEKPIEHGIPSCLFELPELTTLHISGNSIRGKLPEGLNMSKTLTDLTLSYNQLKGPIPIEFQSHKWKNFDLAHNKLSGVVDEGFLSIQNPFNGNISLQVNRLSGDLYGPSENLTSVNVNEGNTFTCDSEIPETDPKRDNFKDTCESAGMSLALEIFTGVFFGFAVLLILYYCFALGTSEEKSEFADAFFSVVNHLTPSWTILRGQVTPFLLEKDKDNDNNNNVYGVANENTYNKYREEIIYTSGFINSTGFLFLVFFLGVLLPVYAVAFVPFRTRDFVYIWNTAFAYLADWPPAIAIGVLIVVVFAYFTWIIERQRPLISGGGGGLNMQERFQRFWERSGQRIMAVMILIVNFSVVTIVNIFTFSRWTNIPRIRLSCRWPCPFSRMAGPL